jgi:hypothetical protein
MEPQRLLDGGLGAGHLAQRLVATERPSAYSSSSSATTAAIASGLRSSSMSVHDSVVEVVWWPANIIEMNMPVT